MTTSLLADKEKEEVEDVLEVERKGKSDEMKQDRRHTFLTLKRIISCWLEERCSVTSILCDL